VTIDDFLVNQDGSNGLLPKPSASAVTAIAFDRQGRLLATEFNTGGLLSPPTVPGALVRISSNGQTVTTLPVPASTSPRASR
jgi:hypothetical protein